MADLLSPQDFAAKVRAKYPGQYDSLSDVELTTRVLDKHPEYQTAVQPRGGAGGSWEPTGVGANLKAGVKDLLSAPGAVYHAFTDQPSTPTETALSTQPFGQAIVGAKRLLFDPQAAQNDQANAAQQRANTAKANGDEAGFDEAAHSTNVHRIGAAVPIVGPYAANIIDNRFGLSGQGEDPGAYARALPVMGAPAAFDAVKAVSAPARGALADVARTQAVSLMDSAVRPMAKDFRFNRQPGAAVLDEGIWGLTRKSLLSQTSDAVSKWDSQLDQALNSPQASAQRLDVRPTVSSTFDPRIQELTQHGEVGQASGLQSMRDAYMGWPNADALSPMDATTLKRGVGKMTQWTGDPNDFSKVQARRALFGSIGDQVASAVPEVADINGRISNLIGARDALDRAVSVDQRGSPITLTDVVAGTDSIPGALALKAARSPGGMSIAAQGMDALSNGLRPSPFTPPTSRGITPLTIMGANKRKR